MVVCVNVCVSHRHVVTWSCQIFVTSSHFSNTRAQALKLKLGFLHSALFKLASLKQFILRSTNNSRYFSRLFSTGRPRFQDMQNWSTTVVTPLSYDTEPTVLITFDNAKYLFNVGENTNRAFYQSRKNWKRMRGIFLTQVRTQRASGLGGAILHLKFPLLSLNSSIGMLMSFADASIDKLNIVGPPGLCHYLASMRMYLYRSDSAIPIDEVRLIDVRKQLDVSTREFLPDRDASAPEIAYQDDNITVYSFPISRLPAFPNHEVPAENFLEPDRKRKRVDGGDRLSKLPKLEDEIAPETGSNDYREGAIRCMFKQFAEKLVCSIPLFFVTNLTCPRRERLETGMCQSQTNTNGRIFLLGSISSCRHFLFHLHSPNHQH